MYAKFQSSYYQKNNEPIFDPTQFLEYGPLIVIDTSNQKEILHTKAITLRIELETNIPIPANTTAFCLILHDRIITYNSLTKAVKQL